MRTTSKNESFTMRAFSMLPAMRKLPALPHIGWASLVSSQRAMIHCAAEPLIGVR